MGAWGSSCLSRAGFTMNRQAWQFFILETYELRVYVLYRETDSVKCTRRPVDTSVHGQWPPLSRGRGPCVWNTVPAEVTCSPSLLTFKRRLKTVVFAWSYPNSSGRVWHFIYCHLRCLHVLSVFFPFSFFVRCLSSHRYCATLISSFYK